MLYRYLQYTSQLLGLPCGGTSPVSSSFVLSEGQNGFYIAIQDPGACVIIRRLVVYRKRCPTRQVGLVLYPETPAPLTHVSVEANCVSNAAGTGLTLMCNSEGVWSGTPQCQCNPGYRTEGSSCTGGHLIDYSPTRQIMDKFMFTYFVYTFAVHGGVVFILYISSMPTGNFPKSNRLSLFLYQLSCQYHHH